MSSGPDHLKSILKGHSNSQLTGPSDSDVIGGCGKGKSISDSVETLDTHFQSLQTSCDADVYKKSEEIIKYFELDKKFKVISAQGDKDDPLYTKVSCPFPSEFDFTDDIDGEPQQRSDAELRRESNLSHRAYEGRRLRIGLKREAKIAVKRSRVLDFLNPAFVKRVSFDTVNKIVDENDIKDLYDDSMRESLLDGGGMGFKPGAVDLQEFARGRASLTPMHHGSPSRALSPNNEPPANFRVHSPSRLSYGQSKIIDIDSSVTTRLHRDFESIYDDTDFSTKPVLPGRTVMVYISGRKHTWVALDWLFSSFLENGDTVVVVAAVNPLHAHFRAKSAQLGEDGESQLRSKKRANHKNSPAHVREVTAKIMKYCLALADPDLIVKIVVELSVGTTREAIRNMYELYKPTVLVTSAKRRIETFPAVAWRSSKIGDKLVSSYIVPVILVPARNMDLFEFSLFLQLRLKFQNIKPDLTTPQQFQKTKLNSQDLYYMMNALKIGTSLTADLLKGVSDDELSVNDTVGNNQETDDTSSIESVESDVDSVKTFSGTSSILGLRETCEKIEKELEVQLRMENKESPDYFKNLLTLVTDASREIGIRMAEIEREDGAGATLIRTITGAPSNKKKYKSLLDVGDNNITKVKTTDYVGSRKPVPKVRIDDQSSPLRPTQSSLKFDMNTPKREILQRQAARKSFSETSSTGKPQLYPLRSSPQISGGDHIHADHEKEKMRKHRFSSFFKFRI